MSTTTTLAKKIETGTHVKLRARACSRDHTPVPAGAWLSQFFGQGSRSKIFFKKLLRVAAIRFVCMCVFSVFPPPLGGRCWPKNGKNCIRGLSSDRATDARSDI